MIQTHEQKSYTSRNATFSLDPARIFEVVDAFEGYIFDERMKFERKGGEQGRFPTYMVGKGRNLRIHTEVGVPCGGISLVGSLDIAELVLSEDLRELTMNVNAHGQLDIDPAKLYRIGETYQKTQ